MAKKLLTAFLILLLVLALVPACSRKAEVGTLSARIEGKELLWDAYEGAASYTVRCTLSDGSGYSVKTKELSYKPPYSTLGDHLYVITAANKKGELIARSAELVYHLGKGSSTDPIEIASADELFEMTGSETLTFGEAKVQTPLHYRLTKDIDLTGREVSPIGSSTKPFRGVFDGNGHTIRGITITKCNTDGIVGLFGQISNAVIKNLTLENATMTYDKDSGVKSSALRLGLLVGYESESYIDNCHVTGSLELMTKVVTTDASDMSVGGILGTASSGALTGCSFKGTIKAQYGCVYAGGIVGDVKSTTPKFSLLNCSSDAFVEGTGTAHNVTTGVSNAYVRTGVIAGNVSAAARLASLLAVGSAKAIAYRDGTALSYVTSGVFGRTLLSGTTNVIPIYNLYYSEEIQKVSGTATSLGSYEGNAHPLSAAAMTEKESYRTGATFGLDFDAYWTIGAGSAPALKGESSLVPPHELELTVVDASTEVSSTFPLGETFLPGIYPITISRNTEYDCGYQLDHILSSLAILYSVGTRFRFSAEGVDEVEITVGEAYNLPYLVYAAYPVYEQPATAFGGYKVIDAASLETYDFRAVKKLTVTVLPAESAEE